MNLGNSVYPHKVRFDPQLVEAKLALGMIAADQMPPLAWDALEAGLDGPAIRRLAALVSPSGWETDQLKPGFMVEAGLKSVSRQEASIRIAHQLAHRILSEGLDPLAYTREFQSLWIRADYPSAIQEVGCLEDGKYLARDMGRSEAEFRQYARRLLRTLPATGSNQSANFRMTIEEVTSLVRSQAARSLGIMNERRSTLEKLLLPPQLIVVTARQVRNGSTEDEDLNVWLVGQEKRANGYKIILRDDGLYFGLASSGLPGDRFPILDGWYGDLLTTFLAM